jgi:hypothetical protein
MSPMVAPVAPRLHLDHSESQYALRALWDDLHDAVYREVAGADSSCGGIDCHGLSCAPVQSADWPLV